MATRIFEFHGAEPLSAVSAANAVPDRRCPFVDERCKKVQSGGACSLETQDGRSVIICPNRLYGNNFEVIAVVARECFGPDTELVTAEEAERRRRAGALTGEEAIVFGQGFSGEIGIRAPSSIAETEGGGSFKIDFLVVKVDENLETISFVAIEVQTIDTTNSYKPAANAYYDGIAYGDGGWTNAGFNWENVSKRILPQLIYKGHALRREVKAQHGLFFILPHPVLEKIKTRIGGELLEYPKGLGTITFRSYEIGDTQTDGIFDLKFVEELTTTTEQVAFAFVSPRNLPPLGIYDDNLTAKIEALKRRR